MTNAIPELIEAIRQLDKVLYVCDRRACSKCKPTCLYTSDIEHAENFIVDEQGNYMEKNYDK